MILVTKNSIGEYKRATNAFKLKRPTHKLKETSNLVPLSSAITPLMLTSMAASRIVDGSHTNIERGGKIRSMLAMIVRSRVAHISA